MWCGERDGIMSSEDRYFLSQVKKKTKKTDVFKGKMSKTEEFTLAYLLNVTHLFGEMSSPYFHLFLRGSSFQHRSTLKHLWRSDQQILSIALCNNLPSYAAIPQQWSKNTFSCLSSWKSLNVFSYCYITINTKIVFRNGTFTLVSGFFFCLNKLLRKKETKQTHNVKSASTSSPMRKYFFSFETLWQKWLGSLNWHACSLCWASWRE